MTETPPNPLRELLGKSWNLELLISGAAIVFATNLPDWVEDSFYLQSQFLSLESSNIFSSLPIMAYAFFKVVAWMLIGALVTHLLMRALWVSMVGLLAAYPMNIRYDRLPNVSASMRRIYEQKLGSMQGYIQRLDKMCNQVLALALLNALMSISVGLSYHLFFWIAQWLSKSFPEKAIAMLLFNLLFLFIALSSVILWFNLKKGKPQGASNPYEERIAMLGWRLNTMILNVLRDPVFYLSLAFMGNIPPRRYYIALTTISVVFMSSVMLVFIRKIGEMRNISTMEVRDYYSTGHPNKQINEAGYDNLRTTSDYIPSVSIQSDVLNGDPFLKVFVAYPVHLDEVLQTLCVLPASPDSLKKIERRRLQDSLRINCIQQNLRLLINDSLYGQMEWMFTEKHGRIKMKGWQAYVPTTGFRQGKNNLIVKFPIKNRPDSLRVYGQLPFWFMPDH